MVFKGELEVEVQTIGTYEIGFAISMIKDSIKGAIHSQKQPRFQTLCVLNNKPISGFGNAFWSKHAITSNGKNNTRQTQQLTI